MIDTLIFDFGDVFINLDKQEAHNNALQLLRTKNIPDSVIEINKQYETGLIDDVAFLNFYKMEFPWLDNIQIIESWNSIIKDFPIYRLDFLKQIKAQNKFKLILLSNTNNIHIEYVKQTVPFYETFKNSFDWFFLSQEIKLRKPNTDIYQFVLETSQTNPENALFVDDTFENIEAAKALGLNVWHINPQTEDITELFTKQSPLF